MSRQPPFRKLRSYAFDPSLSLKMDTANINNIVYKTVWEKLEPGPIGEYVEVIDFDPTVGEFYSPVNLDDAYLLSQDGLDPSESNPQFHQQMVYAVTMCTIRNFERALGRKIIWSKRRVSTAAYEEYVGRLRVYPHAMREANAYYSPMKKALLFGYFSSTPADETLNMPDSLVFTCLSHDIIAHETTHAILDGMHNYFNEPSNPDMLAFHEAFADIVALFQHFTFPEVLKHQISLTRGELSSENLLGQLAQEFGSAIGQYGSLRDAIGEIDPQTKLWRPKTPNPDDYRNTKEPHARGSILVSAIFEAFLNIYNSRIADLLRIASGGTGILQQGKLPPDLVNRFAVEASKAANHVLRMCIRALDYCPPVDLSFGDYLRAIITADTDLVAEDTNNYRLAFIDAFRKRGIYPEDIRMLSVESLRYPVLDIDYYKSAGDTVMNAKGDIIMDSSGVNLDSDPAKRKLGPETVRLLGIINMFLRDYADKIKYENDREKIYKLTASYIQGEGSIQGLHERINLKFSSSEDFAKLTGLAFVAGFTNLGVHQAQKGNGPSFQIQNLRLVSRTGPDGNQVNQVVFSIIQRSGIEYNKEGKFKKFYDLGQGPTYVDPPEGGFEFRGGCTLIFDLDNLCLKYAISKPLLDMAELEKGNPKINSHRMDCQYRFQNGQAESGLNDYSLIFGHGLHCVTEPFAFLHQH